MISNMKVDELKSFLKLRGLKTSGRKEELIARVFIAFENDVPLVKTAVEVEEDLKETYFKKLKIDDRNIPDPFQIPHGWSEEGDGVMFWPMLTYPDIFTYLMFFPAELGSSDMSDYKLCKSYSYFRNGWLEPLLYHNLSGSKYCIIKGRCRPSQSVNNPPRKLWIIFEKVGKIRACHCSCMAGLSQTCNHVAAAFYRIESAVRNGLTNPSCTSKPNQWLPSRKTLEDVPGKIKDLNFVRDDFALRGKKKKWRLTTKEKKEFDPIFSSNKPLQLVDVASALEEIAPNSIIHTAVAEPEIDFHIKNEVNSSVPKLEATSLDDIVILSSSKNEFLENLYSIMSVENIQKIENITRGQAENKKWFTFRSGVITGSKAHEVMTKMRKVQNRSGGCIDMWSLNQKISGRTFIDPNVPALKYGRDYESEAVESFRIEMLKSHKGVKISNCGLYILKEMPFIAASPDGIVSCECCDISCLEIKCPYSINYTSPTAENVNLPYLTRADDGMLCLKQSHKYYTQCQMQMVATGLQKTYFVIWTPHGISIEVIKFDENFWKSLKEQLHMYYTTSYLDSLFSRRE